MNDLAIVICGAAGQGIATVEELITGILKQAGYYCYSTSEFMSRIRGGTNSTLIRVSSKRINPTFVDRIDIFIPFNKTAISRQRKRITKDTIIIGEPEFINHELNVDEYKVIEISWTKMAQDLLDHFPEDE